MADGAIQEEAVTEDVVVAVTEDVKQGEAEAAPAAAAAAAEAAPAEPPAEPTPLEAAAAPAAPEETVRNLLC